MSKLTQARWREVWRMARVSGDVVPSQALQVRAIPSGPAKGAVRSMCRPAREQAVVELERCRAWRPATRAQVVAIMEHRLALYTAQELRAPAVRVLP